MDTRMDTRMDTHNQRKYCTNKENKVKKVKFKVNVYLTYPNTNYYEMVIDPNDTVNNLLKYIESYFPKSKYSFNTENPEFINVDTNSYIDISKSYIDNNLYNKSQNDHNDNAYFECSIKIKLSVSKLKETFT